MVAEKMMELCKSFDTSEQAHRKEHELTGNKAQVKVCVKVVLSVGFGIF